VTTVTLTGGPAAAAGTTRDVEWGRTIALEVAGVPPGRAAHYGPARPGVYRFRRMAVVLSRRDAGADR
jgi:hypothetical protein